jgi:hypothetical protein
MSDPKIRRPLKLDGTVLDLVLTMSEGNPGALSVLMSFIENKNGATAFDVLHLDAMNMRGSQIYVGFKDFAHGDMPTFIKAIRARDPLLVQVVNDECASYGFLATTLDVSAQTRVKTEATL